MLYHGESFQIILLPHKQKMGGNYLNSIIATQEAKRNGMDEAIFTGSKMEM